VNQGRLDPGVDLIQKPLSTEQLAGAVRRALDRRNLVAANWVDPTMRNTEAIESGSIPEEATFGGVTK
jgi:FixJ family two-component response regulator